MPLKCVSSRRLGLFSELSNHCDASKQKLAAVLQESPRNMGGIDGLMARAKAKGVGTDKPEDDDWDD